MRNNWMKADAWRWSALLFVGLYTGACSAQSMLCKDAKDLEKREFSSTTTYVILIGDTAYDNPMRRAMSDGWSLTKNVVFVTRSESPGDISDPHNSYLSLTSHMTLFPGLGTGDSFSIWQGDKWWEKVKDSKDGVVYNVPWFKFIVATSNLPVSNESFWRRFGWRIPMTVHAFEQVINRARETGIKVGGGVGVAVGFGGGTEPPLFGDIINHEAVRLKQKTLLLVEDGFDADDIELFREKYPYPLEVVPFATVFRAMAERDERYAIATVSPCNGATDLWVHDAATYDLLFSHTAKLTNRLTNAHVKSLAKAVGK